jgi:O-methyltransferase domain
MGIEQTSPRDFILDMAFLGFRAQALFVAAELGIADHLIAGSKHIDELAQEGGVHAPSLYRVLRFLVTQGVFTEDERKSFALTPRAQLLRSDIPQSLRNAVRVAGGHLFNDPCAKMLDAVRTGIPAFESLYNATFFEHLANNLDDAELFNSGMASHSENENAALPRDYNFSTFHRTVDVGGGQGGLIVQILQAYPNVKGVLFDRAKTLEDTSLIKLSRLENRCELIAGDFFVSVPPDADCYILKRVLHDWDDESCISILRNCREAMNADGRVLTIEGVIPPGNDPHPNKEGDLVMMVLLRGRERTVAEFQALYEAAGLRVTRILPTSYAHYIIEGCKA